MESQLITSENRGSTILDIQASYVKALEEKVPLDVNGLPSGFWIADVVINSHDPRSPDGDAFQKLEYSQGYPIIEGTGQPFWDRLPEEPLKFFAYFQKFLNLGSARNINDLNIILSGQDTNTDLTLQDLISLSVMYHWHTRAIAYDLFGNAVRDLSRADQARNTEDSHYIIAKAMVDKCNAHFNEHFERLDDRVVLDLFKTAIALERISVNLSPNGGGKEGNGYDHSQTQNNTLIQNFIQSNPNAQQGANTIALDKALIDPETADLVQRLALKVQRERPNAPKNKLIRESSGEAEAVEILEKGGGIH